MGRYLKIFFGYNFKYLWQEARKVKGFVSLPGWGAKHCQQWPSNRDYTPCFFRPVAATNFLCAEVFQIGYDTIVDGAWGTGSRHATSEQMQFACLLGQGFIKKQWT